MNLDAADDSGRSMSRERFERIYNAFATASA